MKILILVLAVISVQSVIAMPEPAKATKAEDCPLRKAKQVSLWGNTNPVAKGTVAQVVEKQAEEKTNKVK